MIRRRIFYQRCRADLLMRLPRQLVIVKRLEHLLAKLARYDSAVRREEFHPVVRWRIVTGGDLDPAGGYVLTDQSASRRGSGDIRIQHIATTRRQRSPNGISQHPPGGSSITSHHHRPIARKLAGISRRVSSRDRRVERFANDASEARDADNKLAHLCS